MVRRPLTPVTSLDLTRTHTLLCIGRELTSIQHTSNALTSCQYVQGKLDMPSLDFAAATVVVVKLPQMARTTEVYNRVLQCEY